MSDSARATDSGEYRRWQAPEVDVSADQEVGGLMTAERIETLEQAARADGYEAGYQEGLAAGQAEIARRVERLEGVLQALAQPLAERDDAVEQELLAIGTALARQLVRRELQAQPDEIVPVIREAIAALPAASGAIEVRLHPDDAELVREALSVDPEAAAWSLIPDPELARGDCRVISGLSQVDARLETRLGALFARFFSDQRHADSDDE